jgi:hypothetical protein
VAYLYTLRVGKKGRNGRLQWHGIENGHEVEICRRSMEVDAADKLRASDLAKVRFCETERVKDWSLHADRVHVTDAEFPS